MGVTALDVIPILTEKTPLKGKENQKRVAVLSPPLPPAQYGHVFHFSFRCFNNLVSIFAASLIYFAFHDCLNI